MRLLLVQRVRDERTFDGVEALVAQIRADVDAARALFRQVSL
jgi:FAD synthase